MSAHPLPADAAILIIDDEFLVLWALQDELERLGFEHIQTASSVAGSLELVEHSHLDFAFLDVNLGDQKSFPVADALDEKGVPYAFVTGYGRAGLDGRFRDATVLAKPVSRRAVQEIVTVADA